MNDNAYTALHMPLHAKTPRLKEIFSSESYGTLLTSLTSEHPHQYELRGMSGERISIYLSVFRGVAHYFAVGRPVERTGHTDIITEEQNDEHI
jgi:hypothetical protein